MGYFILGTKLHEDNAEKTWVHVTAKAFSQGAKDVAIGFRFTFDKSSFKVGNLDNLILMSDAISKVDLNIESVVRKVYKQLEEFDSKWEMRIETNEGRINVETYLKSFKWEDSKYPRSKKVNDICAIIQEKTNSMDGDIKKQMGEYGETKNMLAALNKKSEGNFMTKDLLDVIIENKIPKEQFVNSKYLCTLIAIVAKNQVKTWENNYEKGIEDKVVPRSSKYLGISDKDGNQLWKVVCFKVVAQTFINNAKSKFKIGIRQFEYDEEKFLEEKKQRLELMEKQRALETTLKRTCEVVFSELYIALMHLKTIRMHIECVLRWGVPPNYFSCIFKPLPGKEKFVIKELIKNFAEGNIDIYGTKEEIGEADDYFPFILISIPLP